MNKFIPVKITDKQWAEELVNGKVFMRPLYEFGSWNKNRDSVVSSSFRGDVHEGATQVFHKIDDCKFAKGFSDDFKKYAKDITQIDNSDIKYFKIFSLYRMKYISDSDSFEKPNPKMAEFGDTVVVISDFNRFIERFGKALLNKYKHVCSMINSVDYYDYSITRRVNPIFEKRHEYAYQNELRMAWCELEVNKFACGPGSEYSKRVVNSIERVTLDIGDIRDIAFTMSIDDFLNLRFPENARLHFPMREDGECPSNFDEIVKWTREQMAAWRPATSVMACSIYGD